MARISAAVSAVEQNTFLANCPSSVEVWDWVYNTGPVASSVYEVDTVDPASAVKVPAVGIVIDKPTPTTCTVQHRGIITGVPGMEPRKVVFVGSDGQSDFDPYGAYDPPVGATLGNAELMIRTHWRELPVPVYVSHYNTTDGSNNCLVSDIATTSRNVSDGAAHFDIGTWTPGTAHPTTRTSPVLYVLSNKFSILNDTSTIFTAVLYGADGSTVLASNPVTLTGNTSVSVAGITVTVTGWEADVDKFRAAVTVSYDLSTILPNGGRFSVEIQHNNGADGIFSKTQNDLFYDNETNPPTLSTVSIAESPGQVVTRFIDGVEYYDLGSDFTVSVADLDNLNDESYPTIQVQVEGDDFGLPDLDLEGGDLTDWTNVWNNVNASYEKTNWEITQTNYFARLSAADIRARWVDWFNGSWVDSPSLAILVDTYHVSDTRLAKYFRDEDWRCALTADFDTSSAEGWDFSVQLGTDDALFINGGCEHNLEDFGSYNPNPGSQPDYSGRAATQYVIFKFAHDGGASSGFSLSISGSYESLEYKLAKAHDGTYTGGTVWIDALLPFNAPNWNNGDPDPGFGGSVGGNDYTFGTNNIVYTDNVMYVRVGFTAGQRISGSLSVIFS